MTEVVRKLAIENQTLREELSQYEKKLIEDKIEQQSPDKSITKDS